MINIGFTGHRPDKLYGYKRNEQWDKLKDKLIKIITSINIILILK